MAKRPELMRLDYQQNLVQDTCAGIKSVMKVFLEAREIERARTAFDSHSLDSKEGKPEGKAPEVVINTEQAGHLVSCLERCLLFGLKTKEAKTGSFWEMIVSLAANVSTARYAGSDRYSAFYSDVKFAQSLVLNNDNDKTSRGRAWLRYVLMCSRMRPTIKLLEHMRDLRITPSGPPMMTIYYQPFCVWNSEEHVEILVTSMRQLEHVRFNLELHKAVGYRWKVAEGFHSKVFPPRYFKKPINKFTEAEPREANPYAAIKRTRRKRRKKKKAGRRRRAVGGRYSAMAEAFEKAGVGGRPEQGFPWEDVAREKLRQRDERRARQRAESENVEGWVNEHEFGMQSTNLLSDYSRRPELKYAPAPPVPSQSQGEGGSNAATPAKVEADEIRDEIAIDPYLFPNAERSDRSMSPIRNRIVTELMTESERKETESRIEKRRKRRERKEKRRIRLALKEALEEEKKLAVKEESEYEAQLRMLRDQLRESQDQMAMLAEQLESRSQSESEGSRTSVNTGVPWKVVSGSRVPVRAAPGLVSPVIGYVDPGREIIVVEVEGNWVRHTNGWTNSRAADGAAQLMCLSLERSEDSGDSGADLDDLIDETRSDGKGRAKKKSKQMKVTLRSKPQEVLLRPGSTVVDVVVPYTPLLQPGDEISYVDAQPISGPLSLKAALSTASPPFIVVLSRTEAPAAPTTLPAPPPKEAKTEGEGDVNVQGSEKDTAETKTKTEGAKEGVSDSPARTEWGHGINHVVPWDKKALISVPQAPAGLKETGDNSPVPGFFFLWKQYEKRSQKVMVEEQGGRCPECDVEIPVVDSVVFKQFQGNFCYYTGLFFCENCHTGRRKAVIPSYLIFRGDPESKPVSRMAFSFLSSVYKLPLLNLTRKNSRLAQVHRSYQLLLSLQLRLRHLKAFVTTCKHRTALEDIIKNANGKGYSVMHLMETSPVFSFYDLVQAINHGNRNAVEVVLKLVEHVTDRKCLICANKGFYCEYPSCKLEGTVSYSFQIEKVLQCRSCHGLFHRECYSPSTCPRCRRLIARGKKVEEETDSKQ